LACFWVAAGVLSWVLCSVASFWGSRVAGLVDLGKWGLTLVRTGKRGCEGQLGGVDAPPGGGDLTVAERS
jgi:hypothetical protein